MDHEAIKGSGIRFWRNILIASVSLAGILVLLGWCFTIEFLKSPIPRLVAMNPLTAVSFILSSISLFLLTEPYYTTKIKAVGKVLAYLVLVISIIKLTGSMLGVDTHIDSFLFHDKLSVDMMGNISNRMAPNTALAFLFTGASLLLINVSTNKNKVPSQFIALGICSLGMLSLLGYIYQVQAFYGFLSYIPMAIHTAICFLLLSVAILLTHPYKGITLEFTGNKAGATSARLLIPMAIIAPVLLGYIRLHSEWKGWLTLEFGTALLILSITIVFLVTIWFIIRELNRKDTLKEEAETQSLAVNNELESFSYSVSHDLRAPLRAIHGYSQMLNEDYGNVMDEEGKRILEAIKNNAKKMGVLIDDLLAFSRLGRKEIQKTNIDMNILVENVVAELNKTRHQANILVGNLPAVEGDYSLIYQVVFNLLSNAVKYSSKKEKPVVQIVSEQKNGELIFSIKDNGAGFDMEHAGKLFNVFQRLHMQSEFEGTGVGLAIVQRIITKHGGKVWAEGKVEKGATFYFTLPVI